MSEELSLSEKTVVFDLPKRELAPIVAVLAGEPIRNFAVEIHPELQGQRGWNTLTLIPTFHYETAAGRTDKGNVFVKRFTHTRGREAANYRYLHRHGYPAPKLYGFLTTDAGEEILFLQRLERIGSANDQDKISRWTLLTLAARLNAVPVEPDFAVTLTRPPLGNEDDETIAKSLRHSWDIAESGEIGPELQALCSDSRPVLPRIIAFAHSLTSPIAAMPCTFVCNEIGFGYAPDDNEPFAFDWHGLYIGPRFDAVKHFFGTPEGVRNGWGVRLDRIDEYAAYYVEELNRTCGMSVTAADVLRETRQLWLRNQFVQDW